MVGTLVTRELAPSYNAVMEPARLTDAELLVAARGAPEAFGEFYRRHVRAVQGYFRRRVASADVAFDLTAETFAAALQAVPRYEPRPQPAQAWLFAIARDALFEARRPGPAVALAARGDQSVALDDHIVEYLELLGEQPP